MEFDRRGRRKRAKKAVLHHASRGVGPVRAAITEIMKAGGDRSWTKLDIQSELEKRSVSSNPARVGQTLSNLKQVGQLIDDGIVQVGNGYYKRYKLAPVSLEDIHKVERRVKTLPPSDEAHRRDIVKRMAVAVQIDCNVAEEHMDRLRRWLDRAFDQGVRSQTGEELTTDDTFMQKNESRSIAEQFLFGAHAA